LKFGRLGLTLFVFAAGHPIQSDAAVFP
jgi:hypothetical protein